MFTELTPHLNSTETSLQLSKYITLFSGGRTYAIIKSQNQSHIATDSSQLVSLDVEPNLGLMTRYLLLLDSYGLVNVGGRL
jgi:hypothetical protein